jgi:hypothetical protein
MDDPRSGDRSGRLDELPDHEDDADVASQAGGGVLDEGMTAEVRGTGARTGNAQGLDDEATRRDSGGVTGMDPGDGDPPTWEGDPTPGIHDFTQTAEDADRG